MEKITNHNGFQIIRRNTAIMVANDKGEILADFPGNDTFHQAMAWIENFRQRRKPLKVAYENLNALLNLEAQVSAQSHPAWRAIERSRDDLKRAYEAAPTRDEISEIKALTNRPE